MNKGSCTEIIEQANAQYGVKPFKICGIQS